MCARFHSFRPVFGQQRNENVFRGLQSNVGPRVCEQKRVQCNAFIVQLKTEFMACERDDQRQLPTENRLENFR